VPAQSSELESYTHIQLYICAHTCKASLLLP